jgi:hypothetical protein
MPDPDGRLLYNDLGRIVLAEKGHMPVSVQIEHAGNGNMRTDVRAIIEHVLGCVPTGPATHTLIAYCDRLILKVLRW